MKKIISYLKTFVFSIYIKSDPEKYNREHMGTLNFWRLLFISICRPGRTIVKLRYGQFFKNKKKINISFKKNIDSINMNQNISDSKKNKLLKAMDDLFSNGGVIIDKYFSDEEISFFLKENKVLLEHIKQKPDSKIAEYNSYFLKLSDSVIKFWLDPNLMSLLNTYYGRQIYARDYPYLHYTKIPKNYNNFKEGKLLPDMWHIDHVLIANMFILLEDVSENETCMEILPGTHKYLNYPFPGYSKKTIESSGIQPIKCFGKKGTVHIHIGNTMHRLKPVFGNNRLAFYSIFTPGPNILIDCEKISKCLNSNIKLENLKEENRKILSGLFPRNLPKGYELINDALLPTKFKGI